MTKHRSFLFINALSALFLAVACSKSSFRSEQKPATRREAPAVPAAEDPTTAPIVVQPDAPLTEETPPVGGPHVVVNSEPVPTVNVTETPAVLPSPNLVPTPSIRPGQICGGARYFGKGSLTAAGSNACLFPQSSDSSCDRWGCAEKHNDKGDAKCPANAEQIFTAGLGPSKDTPLYFVCVIKDPNQKPFSEINDVKNMFPGEPCGGRDGEGKRWGCASNASNAKCPDGSTTIFTSDSEVSYLCVVGSVSDMAKVTHKGSICGAGGGQKGSYGCTSSSGECPTGFFRARISDNPTYFLCVKE